MTFTVSTTPSKTTAIAIAAIVCGALQTTRFNFTNEADLQEGVALLLRKLDVPFHREHSFDAHNRIDFLLIAGVGIECKIKGSASKIVRQVHRYMQRPEISSLILLSRKSNVASLPSVINGKPLHIITLWSQSL